MGMLVELRLALLQDARSDERGTEALCRHVGRILDRAERLVARRRSGAYYNTACMYSLAAQVLSDEDLERLHLSRTATIELGRAPRRSLAPSSAAPSREWLERDPDLAAVRHEPHFRTLLESLPPARSDGADDGEVTVPPVLTQAPRTEGRGSRHVLGQPGRADVVPSGATVSVTSASRAGFAITRAP